MKYLYFILLSIFVLTIAFNTVFAESTQYIISSPSEQKTQEKIIDVNVILVGDVWSTSDIDSINNRLLTYYEPNVSSSKEKLGLHYSYKFNFFSVSQTDSNNLFKFMKDNSQKTRIFGDGLFSFPIWQEWWVKTYHPEFIKTDNQGNFLQYNIDYRLIYAESVEKYIYEKIIQNDPNLNAKHAANLVFLKAGPDKVDYLHNYAIGKYDKSTGTAHAAVGLTGYGGNYNMYFFDLYAAPWVDYDLKSKTWYIPEFMNNLHDCTSSNCFTDLVTYHINSALVHIVTPSFVYPVQSSKQYLIDVVVYSKPGASLGLTPQTAEKFINTEAIKAEFEDLYPNSKFDIALSIEKRSKSGLSYEFKKELEYTKDYTIHSIFGKEIALQLYDSSQLQPYLLSWADDRKTALMNSNQMNVQDIRIIPVLVIVDSSNAELYFDSYGTRGYAAPLLTNEKEPCCALVIANEKDVWNNGVGASDLILHEVGHVLGLAHPFQSWSSTTDIVQNNYWNQYSSPMTYAQPPAGCGIVYRLVYSNPCGIASTSFTEFEKDRIHDALEIPGSKKSQAVTKIEKNTSEKPMVAKTVSKCTSSVDIPAQSKGSFTTPIGSTVRFDLPNGVVTKITMNCETSVILDVKMNDWSNSMGPLNLKFYKYKTKIQIDDVVVNGNLAGGVAPKESIKYTEINIGGLDKLTKVIEIKGNFMKKITETPIVKKIDNSKNQKNTIKAQSGSGMKSMINKK